MWAFGCAFHGSRNMQWRVLRVQTNPLELTIHNKHLRGTVNTTRSPCRNSTLAVTADPHQNAARPQMSGGKWVWS
jgi:hypothetical protein